MEWAEVWQYYKIVICPLQNLHFASKNCYRTVYSDFSCMHFIMHCTLEMSKEYLFGGICNGICGPLPGPPPGPPIAVGTLPDNQGPGLGPPI